MTYRNDTESENLRLKAELEETQKALREATDKLNNIIREDEYASLRKRLSKSSFWYMLFGS